MTNPFPEQPLYFIDAEFIEDSRRRTIDLISIGIVCDDGREYYACNDECDLSKANDWVKASVIPSLPSKHIGVNPGNPDVSPSVRQDILRWKTRDMIAADILEFCSPKKYGNPIYWGEWSSFDWVVFCWIFGDMIDLPEGFPMRCRDVIQWAEDHLGIGEEELPPSLETEGNRNALLGARSVKRKWQHCWEIEVFGETQKDALYSALMDRCDRVTHLLQGENVGAALAEVAELRKEVERLANA
ncbi:hypothetical protein [Allocoleopsis sp.]|uniref:hypothetical protein n=1 Tax=Allocoleopsis sp. TaxID=3088169 RepID=UPI002FD4B07B